MLFFDVYMPATLGGRRMYMTAYRYVSYLYMHQECLFVCDVTLTSGQLSRALSRLPQGNAFRTSFTPQGPGSNLQDEVPICSSGTLCLLYI